MHILIATKGVPRSVNTVQFGASLVKAVNGKATLFMVIPDEGKRRGAEAFLGRMAELFAPQETVSLIRVGNPPEAIVKEAGSGRYDLMVIGERSVNALLEPLLTHAVEHVIKALPCPVLVARRNRTALRRFLLCEGGRSTKLLPTATGQLAPLMRTAEKIVVLHVMSQITARPGIRGWELRAEADELIGQHTPEGDRLVYDLEILRALGVEVVVKVRHGVVVEEIMAEARAGDYDVIMLGTPAVTGIQRFLVDDPLHKIIINGDRPVLVV
jgi:nucleotide-binding universal stress UspA family protein